MEVLASFFDFFYYEFPVSQVKTYWIVLPLISLVISFFTSMGGVSGAFLLLPFQVSVLGYTSPSVSATNFVYNIVAIPSGVYRYIKEGRMAWPLTYIIILGTIPGIVIGYYVRVLYLPDPKAFKIFVGCVLLYMGIRLIYEMTGIGKTSKSKEKELEEQFSQKMQEWKKNNTDISGLPKEARMKTIILTWKKIEYEFWGQRFSFNPFSVFWLAFFVGIIGGTYGIGGGAIIAPFCVAVFRLPVYTVAGAALMGTFVSSIAGVFFYSIIPTSSSMPTSPDWLLGFLFGIGGFIGMYFGAKCQKFVPQKYIKWMLAILITGLAIRYVFL